MFNSASMERVNFSRSKIYECYLGEVLCLKGDFSRSDMENSSFVSSRLELVALRGANCKYVDFSYANIKECNFTGANMFMAKMHRTQDKDSLWNGAENLAL